MKLNEISQNLDRYSQNKILDYFENAIELAIEKTVKNNVEYYFSKKYASKYIQNINFLK